MMEEHKEIKNILSRGKKLSAPIDMSDRVLLSLKKQSTFVAPKPLISKWVWAIIVICFVAIFFYTSSANADSASLSPLGEKISSINFDLNLPSIKASMVMTLSLTILGLMFFLNAFFIHYRRKFNTLSLL